MYRVAELVARAATSLAHPHHGALAHPSRCAAASAPASSSALPGPRSLHSGVARLAPGASRKKGGNGGAPPGANGVSHAESSRAAAASAAAAAARRPPPPRPYKARPKVSDMAGPVQIAAQMVEEAKKRERKERDAPPPVALGDVRTLPLWQWKRLPAAQRWMHVHSGVFPLVPAHDSAISGTPVIGTLANGRLSPEQGMQLLHGVGGGGGGGGFGLASLFRQRATIHRIIGFESDLIKEARRDNIHTAEVALVGRSNVGKSSLLNALLMNGGLRKQLAVTSATPGRTQQLFMFSFEKDRNLRIVDCPGYGYAKASLKRVEQWNLLMGLYVRKRHRQGILKRVLVLIDIRRRIGPLDEKFMQFLETEQIPYQVVLTKCDLLAPLSFEAALEDVRAHLRSMPAGRFAAAEARAAYERRIKEEGEVDDEDDQQWQEEAGSEGRAAESLPTSSGGRGGGPDPVTSGGEEFPDFSCSIPLIHVVSSREKLGLVGMQQSLSKMLKLEKNVKCRAYEPEGHEGPVGRLGTGNEWREMDEAARRAVPLTPEERLLQEARYDAPSASASSLDASSIPEVGEADVEDDGMDNVFIGADEDEYGDEEFVLEDDGMDNLSEEEMENIDDQWAPPIPVAHYDPPTKAQKAAAVKEARAAAASSRGSSGRGSGRSSFSSSRTSSSSGGGGRFGRGSRRSFSTSARSSPRSSSAPPPDAAEAEAAESTSQAQPTKAPRARSAKAKTPTKAAKSRAAASVDAATSPTTAAAAAASSSPATAVPATTSSSSDAHLASIYQKKSQREHILDRSETYIGSMHHQHSYQWVYDESRGQDGAEVVRRIVQKECVFVPSLVHIFDEILVNAADNQHRVGAASGAPEKGDDAAAAAAAAAQVMTSIRVWIDQSSGRISVQNDGASIPVATHPSENIPVPELIFGHLLTSSNYDDKQRRFTGGRHGYGAKLTNIFSREFCVEIQDVARGVRYEQTFRDNMARRDAAVITPFSELLASKTAKARDLQRNYTRISFVPDFARFGEKGLSDDTMAIMKKRVLDVAACVNTNIAVAKSADKTRKKLNGPDADADAAAAAAKKIKVYLNDELVDVDSFPKYLDLFPQPMTAAEKAAAISAAAAEGGNEEDEAAAAAAAEAATGKWVFGNINSNWQIAVGPNVASAPIASASAASLAASLGSSVSTLTAATRDISFVNSICTSRGGTHVAHVSDKVVRALTEHILRSHKDLTRDMLPPGLVRAHMSLLVNCKIPNPSFSSQTKESLMTPSKEFGSDCTLSASFLAQVVAPSTGIVGAIVDAVKHKHMLDLYRKQRAAASSKRSRILSIPKLEDANWAGHADPSRVAQTTLILTEGDSAKALVLSSLAILGRDKYGVFPLKGKMLNVRDAPIKAVMDNAEIQNILAITGLEIGAHYYGSDGAPAAAAAAADGLGPRRPASRPLRYGRIMLMTDQDHDGSHIKGLFINLLHHFWPELLRRNDFLEEFVTAIIKVKDVRAKRTLQFHTLAEFETWKSTLPPALLLAPDKFKRAYQIKYYKGLGTNTSEEGKEYFRNIAKHRVRFLWDDKLVVNGQYAREKQKQALVKRLSESSAAAAASHASASFPDPSVSLLPSSRSRDPGQWIQLAFAKDKSHARKEWLTRCFDPRANVDTSSQTLSYTDFINKELIVFSNADNVRSIPSSIDGLKPVQRKILFGCFKRNLAAAGGGRGEVKVAQLSGYISEQTVYHHGEASLQASIIHMAQSFIGSNNIALLVGAGQFGSRNTGGKDAAAARYIFTSLSPITRALFPPQDDALLFYRDEDGFSVEPEFFVPVLPMVLVNGADGIGTGFSTDVPTFNPKDIVANLRAKLRGGAMRPMTPWIRGFTGSIRPVRGEEEDDVRGAVDARTGSLLADAPATRYTTSGVVVEHAEAGGSCVFEITELPSGRWPEEYKSFLSTLVSNGSLRKVVDQGNDESIRLRVHCTPEQAALIRSHGVSRFFKLTSTLSLANMHLFNGHGLMTKYSGAQQILDEFFPVRLEFYRRRREHLMLLLGAELRRAANKIRFIDAVTRDQLVVYKQKKADLVDKLRQQGFLTALQLLPRLPVYRDHTSAPPVKYTNSGADDAAVESDAYDYLLNLPLSSLTAERLAALQAEHDSAEKQLAALDKATPERLWLDDLDKFESVWNQLERKRVRGSAKGANKGETIEGELNEEQEDAAEEEAA